MSACEDQQVVIRWSEEAAQYSITSVSSSCELVIPRAGSQRCLGALELAQFHGELQISCAHMVGKLLTNVDVKHQATRVQSFIASVLPLDMLYRVVAKCLDLETITVFLTFCKVHYPELEFVIHDPTAALSEQRWFEDWLAMFRKQWLTWRTDATSTVSVDAIYTLWRDGCVRAGVQQDAQVAFENAVREFDGQPLSATALHSDAKLLLDAKYTVTTALDLRAQRAAKGELWRDKHEKCNLEQMVWETLALAEFFGASVLQKESLQILQNLSRTNSDQLNITLHNWISKDDSTSKVERVVARITTVLQQLGAISSIQQMSSDHAAPSPRNSPLSTHSLSPQPPPPPPPATIPAATSNTPATFPEVQYATPPRLAKFAEQRAKADDHRVLDSHSQLTSEDTISTIIHQHTPLSAVTVHDSPFCATAPQPHPYPHTIRMQYQAILPDGSLEENSTSSESFIDSLAPTSAASSHHAVEDPAPLRSASDQLLYQEERRRALMRIRATKTKEMQQEVEQREQDRQKREQLRWVQIQAAMARVTRGGEQPSYLTNSVQRASSSPEAKPQNPLLTRSVSSPTINPEIQKAQQLALARVRSKRRQLKLSELRKQQQEEERQQQKWEERNRKIELFLSRSHAAILEQQQQQQQEERRQVRSQPPTPTNAFVMTSPSTEDFSSVEDSEQHREALPSFTMYPLPHRSRIVDDENEDQGEEGEEDEAEAGSGVVSQSPPPAASTHVALTIHRAEGLRESLVGCNPYVVCQCGGQKQSTRVLAGKANPVYDITLPFEVAHKSKTEARIRLDVYSRNEFVCDDHIGAAELRFDLREEIMEEHRLPLLTDDGEAGGNIYVRLHTQLVTSSHCVH